MIEVFRAEDAVEAFGVRTLDELELALEDDWMLWRQLPAQALVDS